MLRLRSPLVPAARRRRSSKRLCWLGLPLLGLGACATLPADSGWEQTTRGFVRHEGYFPLHLHPSRGRLLLEVPQDRTEFLYFVSLAEGIGSNPLGLDRGAVQGNALCEFQRFGDKVLWVQKNLRWRALERQPTALQRTVDQSFPDSVLAAFEVLAENKQSYLIDATEFFQRDAVHGLEVLERGGQGKYRIDESCSVFAPPFTKNFPGNTEISAWLTYAAERAGPILAQQAEDGRRVTVRQHHSLLPLPEDGYQPRAFDPRVGSISFGFTDFARPLDEPLQRRWIQRWRLEKKHPDQALSEPVKPIVFHLDRGIPEPLRSAIREGALWWNSVFEAAGFVNAFQVEDLPNNVDPMDARYSVIQYVHRAERGWSIGASLIDPRTGEILKGTTRMDSHRARTDANLAAGFGLVGEFGQDQCCVDLAWPVSWAADAVQPGSARDLVLARARQLAAHEVGHALGFSHNFAASTYGRASVMDYPAPWLRLQDGELRAADAYARQPGEYDRFAAAYAYQPVPDGRNEEDFLDELVLAGLERGLVFLTDQDSRSPGAAHPAANLWDNDSNPLRFLEETLQVRARLLDLLPEHGIDPREPLAYLARRLVPVYYYHQFAFEAATRLVGGVRYRYALAGDGQIPLAVVSAAEQRAALDLLLRCFEPDVLSIPTAILDQLPPAPPGLRLRADGFDSNTGPTFDRLHACRGLVAQGLALLLHPHRCARLVDQSSRDPQQLGLAELFRRLRDHAFSPANQQALALRGVFQHQLVESLIDLSHNANASAEVRALAEWELTELATDLTPIIEPTSQFLVRRIRRGLERALPPAERPTAPVSPQTSPIGMATSP